MAKYQRQSPELFKKGNLQRKKILSLCHELGWTYPSYGGRMVVNFVALDGWMLHYGYLHKPLNYYTPAELPKLVTQFEEMAAKELTSRERREVSRNRIDKQLKNALKNGLID